MNVWNRSFGDQTRPSSSTVGTLRSWAQDQPRAGTKSVSAPRKGSHSCVLYFNSSRAGMWPDRTSEKLRV
jgi:hypothetical protein